MHDRTFSPEVTLTAAQLSACPEEFLLSIKLPNPPHMPNRVRLTEEQRAENYIDCEQHLRQAADRILTWAIAHQLQDRIIVGEPLPALGALWVQSSEPVISKLSNELADLVIGAAGDLALEPPDDIIEPIGDGQEPHPR